MSKELFFFWDTVIDAVARWVGQVHNETLFSGLMFLRDHPEPIDMCFRNEGRTEVASYLVLGKLFLQIMINHLGML